MCKAVVVVAAAEGAAVAAVQPNVITNTERNFRRKINGFFLAQIPELQAKMRIQNHLLKNEQQFFGTE